MSFNIRYGLAEDGENHWDKRKSLVMDRIKTFDPDLLGLQECRDDSQAEFIKASLQEYDFLGVPRGGSSVTSPEMAPILIKRSTFLLKQWETFWLSETPHIPGSKSWESAFPRTATWAELVHLASGQSFIFLNTHFDYVTSAIVASARLLRDWIDEAIENSPLLITGDFNADKNSTANQLMTGGRFPLQNALKTRMDEHESEGTFHGYGTQKDPSAIDWILVSEHFVVQKAGIDRYHEGDIYPSDHFPIQAILDWKNRDHATK